MAVEQRLRDREIVLESLLAPEKVLYRMGNLVEDVILGRLPVQIGSNAWRDKNRILAESILLKSVSIGFGTLEGLYNLSMIIWDCSPFKEQDRILTFQETNVENRTDFVLAKSSKTKSIMGRLIGRQSRVA